MNEIHDSKAAGTGTVAGFRTEHDCIGTLDVPADAYWGIHTQRAIGNFTVSGITDGEK